MSQSPEPKEYGFFTNVVNSVQDLDSPLRFGIVFLALFLVALLMGVIVPDQFVLLIYLIFGGALLFYGFWEWQQFHSAKSERLDARETKKDDLDHDLAKEKLRYQYEDLKDKRDHELNIKKLDQTTPQPAPETDKKKRTLADKRFAYLDWVRQEVSQLSLQGVDPDATEDENEGQLHLDHVYTALLTAEPETVEKGQESPELFGRPEARVSAVAQLDEYDRLVLLGDPGSGKSTFVNFVAMCLTYEALGDTEKGIALLTAPLPNDEGDDQEQNQPWQRETLIPLRIILRDFAARGLQDVDKHASIDHLWHFVEAELTQAGLADCVQFLKDMFADGQAILLLDGLDEVPEADKRREQIKAVVDSFALKYPKSRMMVTSRTYAYQKQEWELKGFKASVLQPFSGGQIRRFVDSWYAYTAWRHAHPEGWAKTRADSLKEAIFSQKNLYELAERPLLLTLMASLHAWRRGELPSDRQELYEDSVDLLLNRWERRQRVWDGEKEMEMQPSLVEWLKTDRTQVRQKLDKLAFSAHVEQGDQAQTADIPQKKLLDELGSLSNNAEFNPRQLEKYLRDRAGLIAQRGEAVYTFPHRTFQEYLSACHFINNDASGYPDSVPAMARLAPNTWREVLLLAAAMEGPNRVWTLVDALTNYSDAVTNGADFWGVQLAGQLLHETIAPHAKLNKRNERLKTRVQNGLTQFIHQAGFPATERAIAGASLGFLGETRRDVVSDVPEMGLVPAGAFLMGEEKTKHDVTLPAYKMGKYPVTNAQFALFVQDGGYEQRDFWTVDGWKLKEERHWRDARYMEHGRYNHANQPVVGVSWYEAVAYCGWLSHKTGRQFRLPSEMMWEKAARGTDGRIYPWGDEWIPENLNWSGSQINQPSAVGIFPEGASPYGMMDMSGNVWEWCSSVWRRAYPLELLPYAEEIEGSASRGLRGGAFDAYQRHSRAAYRLFNNPLNRYSAIGFRVAEHLSDSDS